VFSIFGAILNEAGTFTARARECGAVLIGNLLLTRLGKNVTATDARGEKSKNELIESD
jgi:hypothetical protein